MRILPKARTLALFLVAMVPTVSRADCIEAQPIYARNDTSRPIWVASYYIPAGSASFVTSGWWKVNPGCSRLLLYNNGRNIYFAAHDDQGYVWGGNATSAVIDGKTVNMFHRDTGSSRMSFLIDTDICSAYMRTTA